MTSNNNINAKEYYIYIMASKSGTLYTGQTNNIISRVYEHKYKIIERFTKKYDCTRLVYYEIYYNKEELLIREKQIKKYNRKKKEALINKINPEWKDISFDWYKDLNVIQPLIHRKGIPPARNARLRQQSVAGGRLCSGLVQNYAFRKKSTIEYITLPYVRWGLFCWVQKMSRM